MADNQDIVPGAPSEDGGVSGHPQLPASDIHWLCLFGLKIILKFHFKFFFKLHHSPFFPVWPASDIHPNHPIIDIDFLNFIQTLLE